MKMLPVLAIGLAATAFLSFSSMAEAKLENRPTWVQVPAPEPAKDVALTLVFSSVVNLPASAVKITDVKGNRVATGNLRFGENNRNVEIPLGGPLRPGVYSISWHAVSMNGQDSVGGYDFTIDPVGRQTPAVAER